MSSGRAGISFKVSKGDIEMMGFHDDQDPESNRNFWIIMIAMILVVIIFVAEMFVLMLDIQ